MRSPDPLRRTLLAVFLLIAAAFAGLLGAGAYGLLGSQALAAGAARATEGLLAAERVRRGEGPVFLPDLPGRAELELALVRGEPAGVDRALARYQQSALQQLLDVQQERSRLLAVQATWTGLLTVAALAGLVALLAWIQRLILRPVAVLDDLARRVLEGDSSHRAPPLPQPEFARLGTSMNAMLDGLQARLGELERSRGNLEALVAAAPTALVEVDRAGAIRTANPAARALAGRDLEGAAAAEALPAADGEGGLLWDCEAPEGRRWLLPVEGGDPLPLAASRVPLGERDSILFVLRDLRPEEGLERLRRETLSVVYRELRSPLGRIVEVSEALRQEELAFLARHVLEMTENLTLADALRRGRWTCRRERFDLGALLDQVVRAHRVPAQEREVALECLAEECPVLGDRARLRLVLHHVLGRALEVSRPGGRVVVRCRPGSDRVVLEVVPDEEPQVATLRDWTQKSAPADGLVDLEGRGLARQILLAHQATVDPGPTDRLRILFPVGRPEEAEAAPEVEVEVAGPEEETPDRPETPSAAALEADSRYGDWLRQALGIPVAPSADALPSEGLEVLLVDLDTAPPLERAELPRVPILALAARPEEALDRFLALGANGLVGREESAASLRRALGRVARGETVLSGTAAEALLDRASRARERAAPPDFRALTAREQEIFAEIARGRTNKEIADLLVISEGTVKTHVNNLLRKLDLKDRVQLLLYAARHDLLPADMEAGA